MSLDQASSRWRFLRGAASQRIVFSACAVVLLILVATRVLTPFAGVMIGLGVVAILGPYWWFDAGEQEVRVPVAAPTREGIDEAINALVDAMPLAALVIDREGHVITFNHRAAELAPTLRRGEHIMFALRMPAIVEAVRRAASGEAQRTEISERVPIDRWFEVTVTPTPIEGANGLALSLLTLLDLTPLRQVEEMRVDFVANASHELRTPLAALSGFIDTLTGPARNDAAARDRFLGIMKAQADRMARVIQDLLSLSRIEMEAHIRPDGEVDLVSAARQVIDGLQVLARERGVEVKIEAPETLVTPGDRDELLRAFENLIENALKYGGTGGRVEVTVGRADGEAKVSVRDYGSGIAPEHLPRLTERFYRVDVSHSRAEGGTGLGLSLVKHILNRHRGRLTIDSVVGTGSNFTAYLPAFGAPAAGQNQPAKPVR